MNIKQYKESGYDFISVGALSRFAFLNGEISQGLENFIPLKYGIRELFLDVENIELEIQKVVFLCLLNNDYKFTKLKESIDIVYNPLNSTNINMKNDRTESGKDENIITRNLTEDIDINMDDVDTITIDKTIVDVNNTSDVNSKSAFDSTQLVENEKNVITENNDITQKDTEKRDKATTEKRVKTNSDSENNTTNYGKITNEIISRIGYEQQNLQNIIMSEREVALFNFMDVIATNVVEYISSSIYDFTGGVY